MAQGYAKEQVGVLDGTNPPLKRSGVFEHAAVRRFRASFNLADTTNHRTSNGDTNFCIRKPPGTAFAYGVVTSSVSLGASTIAVGPAGTPGKYRAAAVVTAVDTPTLFGTAATIGEDTTISAEDILMTIGGANLPGAGTLVIDFFLSQR